MKTHVFTEGVARTCTQALKTESSEVVLRMWLNEEFRGVGIATNAKIARAASAAFLRPRLEDGNVGPASDESLAIALAMLGPYDATNPAHAVAL